MTTLTIPVSIEEAPMAAPPLLRKMKKARYHAQSVQTGSTAIRPIGFTASRVYRSGCTFKPEIHEVSHTGAIEVIMHVPLNTWTNSLNNVAKSDIAFPQFLPV